MSRWLDSLQPWGALLMRLVLGASMLYHGSGKVIPHGGFHGDNAFSALDRFSGYVAHLGLPYWMGFLSAFAEFVGGLFLILGLLTRFFSLLISINLLVALTFVTSHRGYTGSEYPLALEVIALMLLFYGSGALSLDRRFGLN